MYEYNNPFFSLSFNLLFLLLQDNVFYFLTTVFKITLTMLKKHNKITLLYEWCYFWSYKMLSAKNFWMLLMLKFLSIFLCIENQLWNLEIEKITRDILVNFMHFDKIPLLVFNQDLWIIFGMLVSKNNETVFINTIIENSRHCKWGGFKKLFYLNPMKLSGYTVNKFQIRESILNSFDPDTCVIVVVQT